MAGKPSATEPRHPIGVVARRTGLKPDLIRAWERRYGAVEPNRSATQRRFYSDADIERLLLLRRAVAAGRGIGQVANLPNDALAALVAEDEPAMPPALAPRLDVEASGDLAESILGTCLAAVHRLDVRELEAHLERASIALSRTNLLERLMVPLMQRIGDLWQQGTLRPIHEHMASAVVRSFVGNMRGAFQSNGGPQLLVTTPARQHHELGALIAAATAASEGWHVTYLGPDLPAEEVAAAALQKGARAVALSIVYPPDDPLLVEDLRRLRRLLGPHVEIIVGGRSIDAYAEVLDGIGARRADDLTLLRRELERLRSSPAGPPREPEAP